MAEKPLFPRPGSESWVEVTSMGRPESTKVTLVIRDTESGETYRFPIPNVEGVQFSAYRGPGVQPSLGCDLRLGHVRGAMRANLKVEGMSAADLLAEIAASKLEMDKE